MDFDFDTLIIGAGLAGATAARRLAEDGGRRVLVVEQRPHIGGNAYDCLDEAGILVHQYGPHIFHTNDARVYQFLSRFTDWRDYQPKVLANALAGFARGCPAGEAVALSGDSGKTTGPHLHLELKYGKMHLDPAYYVEFLEG